MRSLKKFTVPVSISVGVIALAIALASVLFGNTLSNHFRRVTASIAETGIPCPPEKPIYVTVSNYWHEAIGEVNFQFGITKKGGVIDISEPKLFGHNIRGKIAPFSVVEFCYPHPLLSVFEDKSGEGNSSSDQRINVTKLFDQVDKSLEKIRQHDVYVYDVVFKGLSD